MKHKIEILAENENWIAINKPCGLLSVPDREQSEVSLKDMLNEKYGKVWTVHRLDQPTSGIILFAKNETAHKYLSRLFENRQVNKFYVGLVHGIMNEKKGSVIAPIMEHPVKKGFYHTHAKGKYAHTDYEVLEEHGQYSWMKFQIHTGRTHQIRVHMKQLGAPLVCDEIYGTGTPLLLSSIKRKKFKLSKADEEERPLLNRLALHAYMLGLKDIDGKEVSLEAPIPKDLRATLQQLEKWCG
ncbi:MAG: RluA family pseudouridine synthase [Bacteroidota bacterium]|jgi:23S rRNA pseudouridine1911/1915/1917 synthase